MVDLDNMWDSIREYVCEISDSEYICIFACLFAGLVDSIRSDLRHLLL